MNIKERISVLMGRWKKLLKEKEILVVKSNELALSICEELKNYYSRGGFHIKGEMFQIFREIATSDEPELRNVINLVFGNVVWYRNDGAISWSPTSFLIERGYMEIWDDKETDVPPIKASDVVWDIFRFFPNATSFVVETYDSKRLSFLVFSELTLVQQKRFKLALSDNAKLSISHVKPVYIPDNGTSV